MFQGHFDPIWKGRTWVGTFLISYLDDDGVLQPIPESELEDVTFSGGIYRDACCGPVLSAQSGSGITVAADGVVEWRMEGSSTDSLCPGFYILKVNVTDGNTIEPLFEVSIPVRC
jgi:hypothetical protein